MRFDRVLNRNDIVNNFIIQKSRRKNVYLTVNFSQKPIIFIIVIVKLHVILHGCKAT